MKLTFQILIFITLSAFANAWWGKGHTVVARIGFDILSKQSPATLEKVNTILHFLQQSDPNFTKKEGNYPMVECATFADDLKGHGGTWQSGWHFIDEPYLDQGGKITDFPLFKFDAHNITQAIDEIVAWFNKDPGYTDSYIRKTIMSHGWASHTEFDDLSTALRLLIHYVGDVHQPLHATSRVNKDYPAGDRGGNSVPIPLKGTAKNLHQVWDSAVYEFSGYETLPYTDAGWATNGGVATRLMSTYPIDSWKANDLNPHHWAAESFKIASDFVYNGVEPNEAVAAAYVSAGNKLAEEQLVLGGNRLAQLLMKMNLNINEEEITLKDELIESFNSQFLEK